MLLLTIRQEFSNVLGSCFGVDRGLLRFAVVVDGGVVVAAAT